MPGSGIGLHRPKRQHCYNVAGREFESRGSYEDHSIDLESFLYGFTKQGRLFAAVGWEKGVQAIKDQQSRVGVFHLLILFLRFVQSRSLLTSQTVGLVDHQNKIT